MASEEVVEELKKALGDLQLEVSDVQTTYSSMERNLRLEIETLKVEKFEQDIQMNQCAVFLLRLHVADKLAFALFGKNVSKSCKRGARI